MSRWRIIFVVDSLTKTGCYLIVRTERQRYGRNLYFNFSFVFYGNSANELIDDVIFFVFDVCQFDEIIWQNKQIHLLDFSIFNML